MQVLDGKPNKLIARQLDISEQTVKIHAMHVYRKLGSSAEWNCSRRCR